MQRSPGESQNDGNTITDHYRRASRGFMKATEDMEGIMEKTGNGSTEVVHFELRFEGEGVVLAHFV